MNTSPTYGALRASKITAELSDAQCATLAALTSLRDLSDGEVLVREGLSDSHLYLLVSGSMAVARAAGTTEEVTLFTLKAGDAIGELSFLDDNVHYASVVSRGASQVLGLDRRQFESLLEREPQIVYRVMRAIVRHVHQVQHRLAAQSVELTNYITKQHGRY